MINILRLNSALRLTLELQNSAICLQKLRQKCYQTDSTTKLHKASLFPPSLLPSDTSDRAIPRGLLRPLDIERRLLHHSEAELVSYFIFPTGEYWDAP